MADIKQVEQEIAKLIEGPETSIQVSGDPAQKQDLEVIRFALAVRNAALIGKMSKSIDGYIERRTIEGKPDKRDLAATDQVQVVDLIEHWPYRPWVHVFILNYGPDLVQIAYNEPEIWFDLAEKEDRTYNFEGSKRRFERLYYRCPTLGDTASVQVEALF